MKNCCSYESGLVMGPLFMSGVTIKVMPGVGENEGAGVGEAVGGRVGAGVGDRLGACDGATVGHRRYATRHGRYAMRDSRHFGHRLRVPAETTF